MTGSGSVASPRHGHDHADPIQQRIDRLEGLVKTLVAQGQKISHFEGSILPNNAVWSRDDPRPVTGFELTAETNDASAVPCSAGTTVINGGHSVYKAANDWSDVLQEVWCYFDFLLSSLHFESSRGK